MANPLVEALLDLDPGSPEWEDAADQLEREDPDAYGQWLIDMYGTDAILREIEANQPEK